MKVSAHCPICFNQTSPDPGIKNIVELSWPISDTGIYETTCPHGHKVCGFLQPQLFEVLFQNACNAFIDGYFRETIASASSSLERFYEFMIRLMLSIIPANEEEINKCWKGISNSSERQTGAYVFLYLATYDCKPKILNPNKEVKLRNEVIHKGKIPTESKALEFLEVVYEIIICSLKCVHSNGHAKFVLDTQFALQKKHKQQKVSDGYATVALGYPAIIDTADFALEDREPTSPKFLPKEKMKPLYDTWNS